MPVLKLKADEAAAKLKEMGYTDAEIGVLTKDGVAPEVHIYSEKEHNDLKDRIKSGATEAAEELAAKALKTKHGVTIASKKLDEVVEAIATKKVEEAKLPVDEQLKAKDKIIAERDESLKTLQDKRIPELEGKIAVAETKLNDRLIADRYKAVLPDNIHDALTPDEHVNRVKVIYELVEENGVAYAKEIATGKIKKDASEKQIPFADAVKKLYEENPKWVKPAEAPVPAPGKNPTHAPKGTPATRKYANMDDIMKEVDKQLPNDVKVKGRTEERRKLYQKLQVESKDA